MISMPSPWHGMFLLPSLRSRQDKRITHSGRSAADSACRQPGQGRKAAATTDFAWVAVRSPTLHKCQGNTPPMGLFDDDDTDAPPPPGPSLFGDEPQDTAPKAAAYRVLARKYRPTTFDDLIGQDA